MLSTRRIFLAFLLQVLLFSPAIADFDTASDTYHRKQYAEAFSQFSALAEEGDARAQTVLGIMYRYGEGVSIDTTRAFGWYLQAANQGFAPAQYQVGTMLAEGIGTGKDHIAALTWLERADAAGYQRAGEAISTIAAGTGIKELEELEQKPDVWSRNWNLRLPNEIRFNDSPDTLAVRIYRVQLGAVNSIDSAEELWRQLETASPDLLANYQPVYRKTAGSSRVLVQTGIFQESAEASEFCELLEAGIPGLPECLVLLSY